MVRTVTVKQIAGETVGTISVDDRGRVDVSAVRPEWREEICGVVHRIVAAGVVHRAGEATSGAKDRTRSLRPIPGAPLFLEGLADTITRSGERVGGLPLRAWVEEA